MITLMIRISKEVVTSAQKSYGSTGRARALAAVRPPVMRSLGRSVGGTPQMQRGFVLGPDRELHVKGHSHCIESYICINHLMYPFMSNLLTLLSLHALSQMFTLRSNIALTFAA